MARKLKSKDDQEPPQAVRQSARLKRSLPPDVEFEGKTGDQNAVDDSVPEASTDDKPKTTKRRKTVDAARKKNGKRNKQETAKADLNGDTEVPAPEAPAATASQEHSYWLMKAEPDSRIENGIDVKFSIDDLKACTEPEPWEGVRNHVAKNNMIAMQKGDLAFFYHSNCKTPGVAGIMEIVQESSVDKSAFDKKHPYYDQKSDPEKPRWFNVHVGFQRKFPRLITLKELQSYKSPGQPLADMQLHKQSRLSVSKVSKSEWSFILDLSEQEVSDPKDK